LNKRVRLFIAIALITTAAQILPQTSPQGGQGASPAQTSLAAPPSAQQPMTGKIQGIVVREGTSNPIAGVLVAVSVPVVGARGGGGRGGPSPIAVDPFSMTTDSSGRFAFNDVPAGNRAVTAQLDGYFGQSQNGGYPNISRTTVVVTPQQPAELKIALVPAGVISGRISDSAGVPVADSQVQVLRLIYEDGVPVLSAQAARASDDRGEYRIFRLPPGNYYVSAIPSGRAPRGNGAATALPVKTFYPNVTDPSRAAAVAIKGGEELSGANISIQMERTVTLSGQIATSLPASGQLTGPRGQVHTYNVANSPMTLVPHDTNSPSMFSYTSSVPMLDPNFGKFEIRNVPPGVYDLLASFPDPTGFGTQAPPGQATSPMGYGRTTVDVRGSNVEGISLAIHAGVDVKGRITVNGGTENVQNIRLQLHPIDSAMRLPVYQQVGQYQPAVDENGNFVFPSIPEGQYRIQVTYAAGPVEAEQRGARGNRGRGGPQDPVNGRGARGARGAPTATAVPALTPANSYVEDIRLGSISVYDNGLNVGSQSTGDLDVRIGMGPGMILGTLAGVDQKPATNTMVVLVPPANRRQNFALYKTTLSDLNGKFSFTGVAPGEYQIFAWQDYIAGAYENADYLRSFDGRGTIVNVLRSTTVMAQAHVIPVDNR